MRNISKYLPIFSALIGSLLLSACSTIPQSDLKPKSTPFGFIAVGDTGYISKKSGITSVAHAVEQYCTTENCQFALMAGDNIYNDGATGGDGDAKLFRTRFSKPYGNLAKLGGDFRIYAALGNHDWYSSRKGALAQVKYHEETRPFYMDGLFYSVKPAAFEGELELFVIDTEMMLASETVAKFDKSASGEPIDTGKTRAAGHENALPVTNEEKAQIQWLETALERSTAKWKIVLAHHPLWQSRADSKYAQSTKLRELLLPSLCRYADAYIAGHQHTLELHTDDCGDSNKAPLVHVVSGAGAKSRKIDPEFQKWQLGKYPQMKQYWAAGDLWGFSYFAIRGDAIEVRMITVAADGTVNTPYRNVFQNR